jgi:hypothetical protein
MKERAAELRTEGRTGVKKADGLQADLESISKMMPEDRVLAERVHVAVTANAPGVSPKTWYGQQVPEAAAVAEDHVAQNQQRPGVAEDLERRIDGASATRFRVHRGLILPSSVLSRWVRTP